MILNRETFSTIDNFLSHEDAIAVRHYIHEAKKADYPYRLDGQIRKDVAGCEQALEIVIKQLSILAHDKGLLFDYPGNAEMCYSAGVHPFPAEKVLPWHRDSIDPRILSFIYYAHSESISELGGNILIAGSAENNLARSNSRKPEKETPFDENLLNQSDYEFIEQESPLDSIAPKSNRLIMIKPGVIYSMKQIGSLGNWIGLDVITGFISCSTGSSDR